jgi:hypothetical protein
MTLRLISHFVALVDYAIHYDLPLVVHACPDTAAFKRPTLKPIFSLSLRFTPGLFPRGTNFLLWPLWPLKAVWPFHLALVLGPAQARVRRHFYRTFPTQLHPAAQILLPSWEDPVLPSLYRRNQSQRVFPPQSVVSPTSNEIAPAPMALMLLPLLGGVGLNFGLLILLGGGIIIFLPVGDFLLPFMGVFYSHPSSLWGGISLCRCQWPSSGVPSPSPVAFRPMCAILHLRWECVGPSHSCLLSPCAYIGGAVCWCDEFSAAVFAA